MKTITIFFMLIVILFQLVIVSSIDIKGDKVIKTIESYNQHPKAGKTYYEYDVIDGDTIPIDTIYYDY